ncbi:WD40 repeat domain-containing protein [Pseudomonas quasicaspiana]|uniref:WD40 repeat domain-containing protein n=1 Tax=Pseudomonas quasicaspiana TaxID=2829821 RepID=UPI001E431E1E|nr:WD40 repeat domain-containing protein [Pseudomonas quasicaspiana]MCD5970980.1 WD40 repeat domain-containing protein [Pseudomonas quasicaspiana]
MKCAGFWKYALWAAAIGYSGMNNAAALPQGWQIQPSAAEDVDKGLPSALQSSELAKDGRRLAEVHIVVALPFNQVLPQVVSALRPLGRLDERSGVEPLSKLEDGWGNVLLTRRPDLVRELVRQFDLPKLQKDVRDGALAESEIPERIALIERTIRFQSDSKRMAPLTEQYKSWVGSAEHKHGATGRSSGRVIARVMQLDPVLGRPATVVYLTRNDEYPNPDAGFFGRMRELAELDIFHPSAPKTLHRSIVPGEVFSPVFDALSKLPNANVELGASPDQWRAPSRPISFVTEPKLTLPDTKAKVLEAKAVMSIKSPDNFIVLGDGSVLIIRSYPRALMRWSPEATGALRELWTSTEENWQEWQLSRDASGQSGYLTTGGLIVRFDAKTGSLFKHPMAFEKTTKPDDYIKYFHDGNGVPLPYDHSLSGGRDTLNVWQANAQPAGDGTPWNYTLRFASPRQDMMKGSLRGNSLIKPVSCDGFMPNTWVEDVYGLAELDGKTGKVLRVVKLPRRLGDVDRNDDTGMAPWDPAPFGSVKGGWIAVGFVLGEGKQVNPGMHVVDIASGKVRYSLTLPGRDSLKTAVGSPNGRLLALGSGGKNSAVLWNLENGRSITLGTEASGCNEFEQLQWSPSGERLWGRCNNGLVAWDVPSSW